MPLEPRYSVISFWDRQDDRTVHQVWDKRTGKEVKRLKREGAARRLVERMNRDQAKLEAFYLDNIRTRRQ